MLTGKLSIVVVMGMLCVMLGEGASKKEQAYAALGFETWEDPSWQQIHQEYTKQVHILSSLNTDQSSQHLQSLHSSYNQIRKHYQQEENNDRDRDESPSFSSGHGQHQFFSSTEDLKIDLSGMFEQIIGDPSTKAAIRDAFLRVLFVLVVVCVGFCLGCVYCCVKVRGFRYCVIILVVAQVIIVLGGGDGMINSVQF